MAVSVHTQ